MRRTDIVVGILILVSTSIAAYVTTTWLPPVLPGDPGAAFFPRIALAVMFVFSVIMLFQSLFGRKPKQTKIITLELGAVLTATVYSALLVIGLALASFEISCFAFLAYMLGIKTGRWQWSVITALITTFCFYLLFVLALQVRLPLLFLPDQISF